MEEFSYEISPGFNVIELTHSNCDKYLESFLNTLGQLTYIDRNLYKDRDKFKAILSKRKYQGITTLILIDKKKNLVVGSGSFLLEQKFRDSPACHIEDIIIDKEYRGRGLGEQLMIVIKDLAQNSYKKILDCLKDKIPFYEKLGFVEIGVCMRLKDA